MYKLGQAVPEAAFDAMTGLSGTVALFALPTAGAMLGEYMTTGKLRILHPHKDWGTERKARIGNLWGGLAGLGIYLGAIYIRKQRESS